MEITLTYEELVYIKALVKCELREKERIISYYGDPSGIHRRDLETLNSVYLKIENALNEQ